MSDGELGELVGEKGEPGGVKTRGRDSPTSSSSVCVCV